MLAKEIKMCFGSTKTPEIKQPEPMSPSPSPVEPTEVAAVTQEERRKKLAKMRFGLASTIKTSPRGLVGQAANLTTPQIAGKTKLGV